MVETRKDKNNNNEDAITINNKKRELNEDEEGLTLTNNKKRKYNDDNKINSETEVSKENEINSIKKTENDKQKTVSTEESSNTDSITNRNNNENTEMEIDNSTNDNNNNTNHEPIVEPRKENIIEKKDITKENNDNSNTNETNNKEKDTTTTAETTNKKSEKEEQNKINTPPSQISTKSKPVRKSKRLIGKNVDDSTGDNISKKSNDGKKDGSSPVTTTTTTKRKRMNADQDLITHQEIDNAENLGNKNALEIIKKVIGNSVEDVELVVGAQLPVLVQPDTDRMKYQLGEIVTIKRKSDILKETQDINEVESDDKKKPKKIKGKKGRTSKEDGKTGELDTVSESDQTIDTNHDNETNKENNSEVEMKVDQNTEIDKEKVEDKDDEKMYYIHFINQDKRLDNWRREEDLWTNKKYPEISNDASETTVRTTPYLYIPDDKAKLTRSMKRKYGIINESLQSLSEIDPKLAALEKEREEITKVKNIEKVQFGNYLLNSWYFSPYPNEYKNINKLFICDHCMKYMKYESTLIKHRKECPMQHPPGTLVYEKDNLRVYEIDGKKEKLYCQNFCLLSKLFLDHKTVYYDIEPFLFYVLTEKRQENGKEIDYVMGYFSKEKKSFDDYNLACILVLPPYQRKGYGHFLIEFSYELSKRENKVGSPEKPLSDLGLVGYRTYWQSVLLRIIKNNPKMNFTLRELSLLTSIRHEDIVSTLGSMNMLKYWKGEHSLCVTPKMVEDFLSEHQNIKMEPMVDAALIHDTYITEPTVNKTHVHVTK